MKNTRMSSVLVVLLIGIMVAALFSCAPSGALVIGGDDETVENQTDAPEVNGNGAFEYKLNEDGYYSITGYTSSSISVADIVIPSTIGDYKVTAIAAEAFYYCTFIKSVKIPETVTYIGDAAFAGCKYLETVEMPATVTAMGEEVFAYCESLKSITLPDALTVIPAHTFSGCSALENFEIASTVVEIGDGAFKDCTSLASVKIPDSVLKLGALAFYNCSELKYFEVGAQLEFVVKPDGTIDKTQSTIGEYALYRFHPDMELVYPANSGMEVFYAYYRLDKEPAPFVTEAPETTAAAN